jgi:hypothetical protein
MSKFWYAVTTPYSGLWINSEGRWLGEQLRFDTKAERDTYVDDDTEGKVKAIRARQVQKRQGQAWMGNSQLYGTREPEYKYQILMTL